MIQTNGVKMWGENESSGGRVGVREGGREEKYD